MTPKKAFRRAFGNGFHTAIAFAIFFSAESMSDFWGFPIEFFRIFGGFGVVVGAFLWLAVPDDWYEDWIKNR